MSSIFTIDCGEIILREFLEEDVEAIYQITSQPEVYEFLPDWSSTREQRLDWLTNYEIPSNRAFLKTLPHISDQNYLKLGIILKRTNEFIGFCTTGIKEELNEPNREIAYAISRHYRNKGYATKAVTGLINFLFTKTDVELLNAVVLPNNKSSNKVILKNNFRPCGNMEITGDQYDHFILKKEEWMRHGSKRNFTNE
ncbi:hypothetical protein SAMN04487944_12821 [Gracilibacillus ureilyticus]|uniref:N-acetyltransferase domain-containing protein n=1 Tax=Gracilibacillus ureilyticus TaxID=531814 RepID=A0A1H9VVD6_9BACI|nr:GNAT family N-acetyltransferase [Gracilibacillus ureilyticus]SES25498.1 hypothetical protein SAMN04487944_12821 [Gracilibacillus ureilyticus]